MDPSLIDSATGLVVALGTLAGIGVGIWRGVLSEGTGKGRSTASQDQPSAAACSANPAEHLPSNPTRTIPTQSRGGDEAAGQDHDHPYRETNDLAYGLGYSA